MPKHFNVEEVSYFQEGSKVKRDTIYHRMNPFMLADQLGDSIGLENIDGRIVLVNFFDPEDKEKTNKVMQMMEKMQNSFAKSDTGLHLLSIALDTVVGGDVALRKYADRYNAKHDSWYFLDGSAKVEEEMVEEDFKLNEVVSNTEGLTVTSTLILLDRFQHVRGYYDALDSLDMSKCARDASLLMIEKESLNGVDR